MFRRITLSVDLGLSLRNQKQMQPHHGLKTVAKRPPVTKYSALPLLEVFAQQRRGGCSDTLGPRGGYGQAVGQGLLPRNERMLAPLPRGPRRKGLLLSGLFGLLQGVAGLISKGRRQQGSAAALPGSTQSQWRA